MAINEKKRSPLSFIVLICALLISSLAMAQNATKGISGVVVDDKGEPILGVSVTDQSRHNGAMTDPDGKFNLNVPVGTKLFVSYIGYQNQTAIATKESMRIVMKENTQMLDEVQVVAYGVQKKETVTGAIASVKGEELTKVPTGSVSNMLTGQLAGLTTVQYSGEPGSDAASIFVRGQATWINSAPLIQVDGVDRSFNDIDPNEIASITILKDASATAVFGVRGANGVVLITTKRGKEGKAQINVTSSVSVVAPTKTIELANSYQYATFYNQMQMNDHPDWTQDNVSFSPGVIQKFQDHSDPIRFPDTNWVNYCLKRTTLQTQNNINISGGSKLVKYFVSAGMFTQGGLFKDFNLPYNLSYQYHRFNYRSNLDLSITKSTTLSLNIGGDLDNAWKPYTGLGSSGMLINMYFSTPFSSPGLVDGKMVNAATDYNDLTLPFVGGNGMSYYGGGFMQTSNNRLMTDVILNQNLDFVTKGLSFKLKGSYNSNFISYTQASGSIASYTPVLQDDGSIAYKKSGTDGQLSYSDVAPSYGRNWYAEASLGYDRKFGSHHVTGLVLYNESKIYYPSTYPDKPNGYDGLVGRVTYDYAGKYMLEFNVGKNGSENFSKVRRYGLFPALSLGWNISEENFWKPMKDAVNYFKLRYSIGELGNDKIGGTRYMYAPDPYNVDNNTDTNRGGYDYYFGINNGTPSLGAYEALKNNPIVTWENSLKKDYGLDVNFMHDRLTTTFDYFTEHRTKILLQDGTAPSILGFITPYSNLGIVDSHGWELAMKWNDKIGSDFRYNVGVNLMYNWNKIIEKKEAPLNNAYQYAKGHRIGSRSQYQFFGYYNENTAADYQAKYGVPLPTQLTSLVDGDCVYVDLDGNGYIDSNDMTRGLGHTDDPAYMAGINLGCSWKGLSITTAWAGAWDVTRSISSIFRKPFTDRNNSNQGGLLVYQWEHTWTKDNPDPHAEYPRASIDHGDNNNYVDSRLWEKNASYLRLKSMQIAYDFNMAFMKKLHLNTFQLALSGYNLLTFTKYIWGDPETVASSSPTYPLAKTYSLSLKLGF